MAETSGRTPGADYRVVTRAAELAAWVEAARSEPWLAFDTEFVSEDTYRPQLCLIQAHTPAGLVLIDPLATNGADALGNSSAVERFWQLVAEPGREVIVHAGREELCFCLAATGRTPERLVDVQLAAGLSGFEYPAGYGNLVQRLLGRTPHKGETRTDWRRRPLTERQLHYAAEDVRHLPDLRNALGTKLERAGRGAWLDDEMQSFVRDLEESLKRERWRRVSGSSGLPTRGLAVVREVWLWREGEAERRNAPPKKILRDDLIVELARRKSADVKQLRAVRGMERRDLKEAMPAIAAAVERGLATPDRECPRVVRTDTNPQLNLLGQFLATALASVCRQAEVASSLVGTVNDVREFIAWRLDGETPGEGEMPHLARGWRAEIVGRTLDDLLEGRLTVSVVDPRSERPLRFEPRNGAAGN